MGVLGPHLTDCEIVLSQIKHQEKQLCLKRRWLMGLPLSRLEQERIEGPKFLKEKTLLESLLREDDIFFETAKGHVEEAYGVQSTKSECSVAPENFEPFDMPKTIRHLHSHINDLTTRGLYHFTMIVTGGSIKDMKTRQSMQKVVKEYLPKVLRKHRNSSCICEMCKQLHQLLSNPRNFRGSNPMFLAPATRSEKAAVIKLLDRLDGFPYRVLVAISRELKGKPVKAPSKCGRSRDDLVRQVRTTSMNMLSELDEGEALQEPLAKAMTIAVLSLKLTSGPQNFYLTGFREISPQVKALQDDIVKAIWLLRTKEFQSRELDKLRVFFYPENKISRDYIKPSVKKMLTEYLFDSCDVEAIPKSILEGLAFINCKSRTVQNAVFSKDELKEEVECIMDLSAQTKQLAWDLLPENEYHKGFTDAYLEELQESDDDDFSDEDGIEKPLQSWKADGSEAELVEGFGESVAVSFGQMPFDRKESSFSPLVMTGNVVTPKLEPDLRTRFDSASPCYAGASFLFEDSKHSEGRACMEIDRLGHTSDLFSPVVLASDTFMTSHVRFSANSFERHKVETDALGDQKQYARRQCPWQNQYLAIQDVCDETSMVAYNLVGFMLEELVRAEGLELDARERFYLKGEYSCEEEDHSDLNEHGFVEGAKACNNGIPDTVQHLSAFYSENLVKMINYFLTVARKKKANGWDDEKRSVIHRAIQMLIPSLQKSAMGKVEEIMEIR